MDLGGKAHGESCEGADERCELGADGLGVGWDTGCHSSVAYRVFFSRRSRTVTSDGPLSCVDRIIGVRCMFCYSSCLSYMQSMRKQTPLPPPTKKRPSRALVSAKGIRSRHVHPSLIQQQATISHPIPSNSDSLLHDRHHSSITVRSLCTHRHHQKFHFFPASQNNPSPPSSSQSLDRVRYIGPFPSNIAAKITPPSSQLPASSRPSPPLAVHRW